MNVGLQVASYLSGSTTLSELSLTKENAVEFLTAVKTYDKKAKGKRNDERSSYEIRTKILDLASPHMTTCQVYTRTLNPAKMVDRAYLQNPRHWVDERNAFHAQVVMAQFTKISTLSRWLGGVVFVEAWKGNSGAAKTTSILAKKRFSQKVTEKIELSGTVNPDNIKTLIKKKMKMQHGVALVNMQVHEEGVFLCRALMNDLVNKTSLSLVVDARLSSKKDFELYVLSPLATRKCQALVHDSDIMLRTSFNRILVRDPAEEAPCVSWEAVVKGFIETRYARSEIIEIIKTHDAIVEYTLSHKDVSGHVQRVAAKEKGIFTIINQELFQECCRTPTHEEIDNLLNQMITPEYIATAISCEDIFQHQKNRLARWQGKTVKQAMELLVDKTIQKRDKKMSIPTLGYESKDQAVISVVTNTISGACSFIGLGRSLSQLDIGKKIIRTAATKLWGDWSYTPQPNDESIRKNALILKEITSAFFICETEDVYGKPREVSFEKMPYDDTNWLSVEEFHTFLINDYASNKAKYPTIATIPYRDPYLRVFDDY